MLFNEFKQIHSCSLVDCDFFWFDFDLECEFGCSEAHFEKWLNNQKTFHRHTTSKTLAQAELSERWWLFFVSHYTRQTKEEHLVSQYPDGYFETINEDGKVACFLPEPSGRKPFRVSIYDHNGPLRHEIFDCRFSALQFLCRNKYQHKEGVLDALLDTDSWNRGVFVTKWILSGLGVKDGYNRDVTHYPELKSLFPNRDAA